MPENPGGAYFEKEAPLKTGNHKIVKKMKSPFGRGEYDTVPSAGIA